MKTAYVYPISIDNKARYCALHGCEVVVGGTVPECVGRSARWNKVAWLRRSFFKYKWLVWMDLDALFARPDVSLTDLLDPAFDLHVTYDFGHGDGAGSSSTFGSVPGGTPFAGGKINTGFFALKTSSTWSFLFLEKVWAHNDFGQGRSDQASINHVISLMSSEEKQRHIKVRARRLSFRFIFMPGFSARHPLAPLCVLIMPLVEVINLIPK